MSDHYPIGAKQTVTKLDSVLLEEIFAEDGQTSSWTARKPQRCCRSELSLKRPCTSCACSEAQVKLLFISQKKKMPINFFETYPECSLPSTVSQKRTIKMTGHHSRLRVAMGQSYPIYASVHVTFCGSSKHGLLK